MTTPHNFSNTASGATLGASLSSSATSVLLDAFTNFPAAPFTATIDRNLSTEEIVLVSAVVGTTVTIERGYDATTAQAHSAGATFEHTAIAKHFREAAAHPAATSAHGTTSAVVGVFDAQTLRNKTIEALKAVATGAAAGVEVNAPAGVTSKLFRGLQDSVERFFVDYLGNVTAVGVTGATATFSGALSAAATTLASLGVSGASSFTGNVSMAGTLAVTGVTTLTGALNANGGIVVPAGKTVAANGGLTGTTGAFTGAVSGTSVTGSGLVSGVGVESTNDLVLAQLAADDAGTASKQTVWARADGGLYTRSGTGGVRRVPAHWGSGTTLPSTGLLAGDTYDHDAAGMLHYNGAAWQPALASIGYKPNGVAEVIGAAAAPPKFYLGQHVAAFSAISFVSTPINFTSAGFTEVPVLVGSAQLASTTTITVQFHNVTTTTADCYAKTSVNITTSVPITWIAAGR